jgi:hypothetical protein
MEGWVRLKGGMEAGKKTRKLTKDLERAIRVVG